MNGKIILNHDVLLPEYLPAKLVFREEEYQQLITNVKNRIGILIIEPVSSGKTSLVKLLQKELGSAKVVYVDCLVHDTEYAVLRAIVPTIKAHFLHRSFELIEELKRISQVTPLNICFDNFVRLKDLGVIEKVMAVGITTVLFSFGLATSYR